jgi:hypothetical protein
VSSRDSASSFEATQPSPDTGTAHEQEERCSDEFAVGQWSKRAVEGGAAIPRYRREGHRDVLTGIHCGAAQLDRLRFAIRI